MPRAPRKPKTPADAVTPQTELPIDAPLETPTASPEEGTIHIEALPEIAAVSGSPSDVIEISAYHSPAAPMSSCQSMPVMVQSGVPAPEHYDIIIVGAGPGGIAAACIAGEAAQRSVKGSGGALRIALIDDNPLPGGQIWRGEAKHATSADAANWLARLARSGVEFIGLTRIMDRPSPGILLAESRDASVANPNSAITIRQFNFKKLILATGARERFLPFPGWTLPGVLGAGGLQAQVKNGLPIAGKRVVVAGTGPLLMAVAAYMVQHGATVPVLAEQAPLMRMARFGVHVAMSPAKVKQGLALKAQMRGVSMKMGCWPVAAEGDGKVERVVLTNGRRRWTERCDYLACGWYLIPSTELAMLLGCTTKNGAVEVNGFQETSVAGVYSVGESLGIGGLECALIEGKIAGHAAAGEVAAARGLAGERHKARKFQVLLDSTFALRDELKSLPDGETILCRCEDVTLARVARHHTWRSAKLHTRCGMGPCQGRICGGAASFLLGLPMDSVRPPVFPARLDLLACNPASDDAAQ